MAYEIGYDIVVKDDEYEQVKGELEKRSQHFNDILKQYEGILDEIIGSGITSGQVNENLKIFKENVTSLESQAEAIAQKVGQCGSDFVSDFDKADNCLF